MDPLTNEQMKVIRSSLGRQFGHLLGSARSMPSDVASFLRFDPEKVLIILNRHRELPETLSHCRFLYENADLQVVSPASCAH